MIGYLTVYIQYTQPSMILEISIYDGMMDVSTFYLPSHSIPEKAATLARATGNFQDYPLTYLMSFMLLSTLI